MVDHLNVSYLYKKRGVYYFSKRVPCDVRSYYNRDRIVICLKTKSSVSAIRASKSLYQRLDDYWTSIRLTNMQIPAEHLLVNKPPVNSNSNAPLLSEALSTYLKLKGKGKDKKKRTAQSAYQKERLGDAFIDNKILIHKAKQYAFQLAEDNADKDMIVAKAHELVKEHSNEALSPEQLDNLITYVQAQVDKHLKLDRIEASIIDTDDKNVVFMWSKIKRRYPKNNTFTWTNDIAAKEAHCSKSNVKTIMRKLEKLGAITCIQKGKSGSFTKRANLYRREV